MQTSLSWRFAESGDQMLHVALYVRDAMGLDVPPGPGVPPAADPQAPDLRHLLRTLPPPGEQRPEADGHARATAAWTPAWDDLIAVAARDQDGDAASFRHDGRWDPPAYEAIADPALRAAAVLTGREALDWAGRVRHGVPDHVGQGQPPAVFAWETARDAVAPRRNRGPRLLPGPGRGPRRDPRGAAHRLPQRPGPLTGTTDACPGRRAGRCRA